jgi:hypothetical protein
MWGGGRALRDWVRYTPDGLRVNVRRGVDTWIVSCGDGGEACSQVLDVALIEAIRAVRAIVARPSGIAYGVWTRAQADQIEREHRGAGEAAA